MVPIYIMLRDQWVVVIFKVSKVVYWFVGPCFPKIGWMCAYM